MSEWRKDHKTALITGVTGQDGYYLAHYLLSLGEYDKVYGLVRQSASRAKANIKSLTDIDSFEIIPGDMTDPISLRNAVMHAYPDELYNLAAQSFVGESWRLARYTIDANFYGVLSLLELIREASKHEWHRGEGPKMIRMYQASTSEMFGNSLPPQDERTPMIPRSPYGVSKLAAHTLSRVYRESYGLHVSCGILFNHESPRRGHQFVTRKIARQTIEYFDNRRDYIVLGNLDSRRDWGHAEDYVRAMYMMVQSPEPDDYVIASGQSHSVLDFVKSCFWAVHTLYRENLWNGRFGDAVPFEIDYSHVIKQDARLMRPAEVFHLRGDSTRAKYKLGWEPDKTFQDLVADMVTHEYEIQIRGNWP